MTYLTRLAIAVLAALAIAGGAAQGVAQAQDKVERARATTQQLLTKANQALAMDDNAALRSAIRNAFDFGIWERFLTEPRADRFSPQQRARFRELLPGYLAYLYHEQFDRGLATPPSVGEATPARNDVLVAATFQRVGGNTLPVQWRLRETPQGPQIIDVMVGGTSFLLLKRDEFTSMIDRGGVESLLTYMQQNSL
ncbi:MAG TPA: ABC transporter substrate-binding protein [Paracoccaceae bacterium]|nr:ABC transporter substrate-binding protein [Paracoccaceae bacterium]